MSDEGRLSICFKDGDLAFSCDRCWEYHSIRTPTNSAAESHVSKNQAGILMQDELQLERHQAAHDHHVRFERTLLRGFVVISLL
jgi:hypothetical protein